MEQMQDILFDKLEYILPFQNWLIGGDADSSLSYCRLCAEYKVARGDAEDVIAGFKPETKDGCLTCHKCGRLLEYTLTDKGVAAEIRYFSENEPGTDTETIFRLIKLLDAAPDNPAVLAIVRPIVGRPAH